MQLFSREGCCAAIAMPVCPKPYAVVDCFGQRVPTYAPHIAVAYVASSNKFAFDGMAASQQKLC